MKFTVITPVYEDVEACTQLFRELARLFGDDVRIVAIDDGSVRRPLGVEPIENAGLTGVVVRLRRNVGHQRAIAVGIDYVAETVKPDDLVVVMDSDGEDVPVTIPELLERLGDENVDIVVAARRSRIETLRFKVFYAFYKRFFRLVTGRSISFGNFMAMNARSLKRLAAMQEVSIHVASAVLASKLRIERCEIDRGARYAGRSRMNFVGLALHGFKGLMVFAEDVLVRVGIASAIIGALSIMGALLAVFLKLLGFSTPGWFSVALGILVLMFLQTGALSLMTLMLTGVMRSGSVTTTLAHRDFIDEILEARPAKSDAEG